MIHNFPRSFALPGRRPTPLVSRVAPMTPWDYLRLRREAAGLSPRRIAAELARNAGEVAAALDLVHALESPGTTARHPKTLDRLAAVFAFDPDVYRQLATEPADRHPFVCHGCGCSRQDPCTIEGEGLCRPAFRDRCSHCLSDRIGR